MQELGGRRQRGQLFGVMAAVRVHAAVVAGAGWLFIDEAETRFRDLVRPRSAMLAACDPSIVPRLAIATCRSSAYAEGSYPCVLGELRTAMCETCIEVAAVGIAVDREARIASRSCISLRERRPVRVCAV